MNTITTKHAVARMQQRGISEPVIELIEQYGKPHHDNNGVVRMMIPKNRIFELMKCNPTIKSLLDKAIGVYLVLSAHDLTLITAGHYYR